MFELGSAAPALTMPRGAEWLGIALSYLLGSVPFAWLLARMLKGTDLRTVGSGNIGATNAGRVLGRPLGVLAFLLDFGKGWAPVALIAPRFAEQTNLASVAVLCGLAAAAGHVWPIYLGFRGGKAVATTCGVVAAIDPVVFVLGGGAWLITLFSTGFVSLASIAMALVFPIAAWQRAPERGYEAVIGVALLALLILWRHKANLVRMRQGLEPRMGKKSSAKKSDEKHGGKSS